MTGEDVVIRDMELADIEEVLLIEKEAYPIPWTREQFIQEITGNEHAVCPVLERSGTVIAYAVSWILFEEFHLLNIAVKRDERGKGRGALLLRWLEETGSKVGVKFMCLEVRRSNHPAINLYLKQGFIEQGVRKGYYRDNGEDAILFYKQIGNR